jgi:hypothetical protein
MRQVAGHVRWVHLGPSPIVPHPGTFGDGPERCPLTWADRCDGAPSQIITYAAADLAVPLA